MGSASALPLDLGLGVLRRVGGPPRFRGYVIRLASPQACGPNNKREPKCRKVRALDCGSLRIY